MTWRIQLALVLLLLGCASQFVHGEVLDRVVAVVNGHPILASEWDEAVRYECFLNQHAPGEMTAPERQAALQRLVDQRLMEAEMKLEGSRPAREEEIGKKIADVRQQILRNRNPASSKASIGAEADREWQAALAQYGFTQAEVEEHMAHDLDLLRFVDRRFRPSIQIEPSDIEQYYRATLMPQLQKAGAPDPPLADVSAQIRELLTQKALDEQLNRWLQTLRQQGKIQMR
ncbi:MAG TPA: SurA N-terminal domain-containing protein [Terriglobales bacterium]|jgi:hypothetical protein|nr:SurA N-terminal domain-containing protein [Terriglobales bacterium]